MNNYLQCLINIKCIIEMEIIDENPNNIEKRAASPLGK